jgi:hypothetical protein
MNDISLVKKPGDYHNPCKNCLFRGLAGVSAVEENQSLSQQ